MFQFLIDHHSGLADIAAVAALILSLLQWIQHFSQQRTHLKLEIQNIMSYKHNQIETCNILFTISNKSASPIAITRIILGDESGAEYPCCLTHKYICEHYYNKFPETDIPCTERIFSTDFPICLPAHGCVMPFVVFDVIGKEFSFAELSEVYVKVITDKKVKTFYLSIPNNSKNELSL